MRLVVIPTTCDGALTTRRTFVPPHLAVSFRRGIVAISYRVVSAKPGVFFGQARDSARAVISAAVGKEHGVVKVGLNITTHGWVIHAFPLCIPIISKILEATRTIARADAPDQMILARNRPRIIVVTGDDILRAVHNLSRRAKFILRQIVTGIGFRRSVHHADQRPASRPSDTRPC